MSILGKIMKHKKDHEDVLDHSQENAQSDEQIDQKEHPVAEVSENQTATVEIDAVKELSNSDKVASDEPLQEKKIETIPLGMDELKALRRNNYEKVKAKCTKTFVFEKLFWTQIQDEEGIHPVRVKRVAELKAASFLHALNMIGWDKHDVTLVSVKDDYNGELDIKMDGKVIGKVSTPRSNDECLKFEQLGGTQRKEFVKTVKESAMRNPVVEEWLQKRNRIVTGWAFAPYSHINLRTKKESKTVKVVKELEAEMVVQ